MLVSVSATAAVLTDLYLSSEFSFGIPVISGAAVVGIAMLSLAIPFFSVPRTRSRD